MPAAQPPPPPAQSPRRRQHFWSVALFILLASGVLIRAYQDLSRPEAWDYWKDQYVSPSLTSQVIDTLHLDGTSQGRRALLVSGTIGPAAANWFRGRLDQANLAAGDIVLLASPGGDLNAATMMGEIIRSRGLATAVGSADAAGRVRPAYCASACVLVYAGGKTRFGVLGSALGVHQFVTTSARERSRRRGAADCRRRAGLHDQNGGLFGNRGSDVRDPGHSLAQPQTGAGDEPRHRPAREALSQPREPACARRREFVTAFNVLTNARTYQAKICLPGHF
jgi:hypothetical protein